MSGWPATYHFDEEPLRDGYVWRDRSLYYCNVAGNDSASYGGCTHRADDLCRHQDQSSHYWKVARDDKAHGDGRVWRVNNVSCKIIVVQ